MWLAVNDQAIMHEHAPCSTHVCVSQLPPCSVVNQRFSAGTSSASSGSMQGRERESLAGGAAVTPERAGGSQRAPTPPTGIAAHASPPVGHSLLAKGMPCTQFFSLQILVNTLEARISRLYLYRKFRLYRGLQYRLQY